MLARQRLAVHLVGEHHVVQAGLLRRQRVDVRLLGRDELERVRVGFGPASASTSSSRTPPQWTFFTVQPVTQWNVETCSTFGSDRSSS